MTLNKRALADKCPSLEDLWADVVNIRRRLVELEDRLNLDKPQKTERDRLFLLKNREIDSLRRSQWALARALQQSAA